jgi:transposase-like protein
LDRAREARLGRETSVGESTFTEVILESLNNGATPEQAAQEAAMRSELLGIQVDQKTLSSWIKQAKEMKTLKDEETIQTEQTIEEPEIEKEIRELSVRGVFNNADIRSALISRGYTQKEINQSSVASAVGKISDFGSSFFVNLFGD